MRAIAGLLWLFAPVVLGVAGFALLHSHRLAAWFLLAVAGIWMVAAFANRNRSSA
jgi:hypothetical protein